VQTEGVQTEGVQPAADLLGDARSPRPVPALDLVGVTRRFRTRTAVDDVSVAVRPGELFALLGPSGSGKTTLLRLIAGFDAPDAGTVTIGGRPVAGPRCWVEPEHRGVGLVPQGDTLFPHLTVADNVAFGIRRNRARALDALELVGLADRADSRPAELSGGERQRVALARALAPGPSLILLDEPFSSLDAALRRRLRRDVVDILRTAGATAVLVTHDQEEALALADRVAVLRSGRLVQHGAPADLYWAPCDAWTARFVGDVNVLPAEVTGSCATTALGPIATRPGHGHAGARNVAVRPEHLALRSAGGAAAVVVGREFRGHHVLYEVRHPTAGELVVQGPSFETFAPGDPVTVVPDDRAVAAVLAD
jgi:iron(III) transport system ATP-binding protein